MPHPPREELELDHKSKIALDALFVFYALVIFGTPALFISYLVKYN